MSTVPPEHRPPRWRAPPPPPADRTPHPGGWSVVDRNGVAVSYPTRERAALVAAQLTGDPHVIPNSPEEH